MTDAAQPLPLRAEISDASALLAEARRGFPVTDPCHNLLLGVLRQAAYGVYPGQPWCWSVRDGERLVGMAIRTPPMPLTFSAMPLAAARMLYPTLLSHLADAVTINGPAALTDAISDELTQAHCLSRVAGQRMRLFELRSVLPVPMPEGKARQAVEADSSIVATFFDGFEAEAIPQEQGLRDVSRVVNDAIRAGRIFVWEREQQVVAYAARSRDTGVGASVGPVYTAPHARGCGFATALVAHLSQLLLDEGKIYTCLFTDLANPISNRIYPRIGYTPVHDFAQWKLSRA